MSSPPDVAALEPPKKRVRRSKEEKEAAKPKPPSENPNAKNCNVWIGRKARFCGFPKLKDGPFCGHHGDERVPCTVNPKHTVKASALAEHVLICNDRHMLPPTDKPYFRAGVNSGLPTDAAKVELSDDIMAETLAILARTPIDAIDTEVLPWPPQKAGDADAAPTDIEGQKLQKSAKHETQIASLLGHLHAIDALPENDVAVKFKGPLKGDNKGTAAAPQKRSFVEFGAGKGSLAVSVARVLYGEGEGCGEEDKVLLIDRSNFRRKCLHPCFCRVVIDLEDLLLDKIPGIKPVVGFSKHLCGVATDFTLRCCLNADSVMHSMSIALCCHHRCTYEGYINQEYLKNLGITAQHFAALKKITSWTVDGDTEQGAEKALIGRKAKRVLDIGRVQYLREKGWQVRLVHYVAADTTPENCLLVATRP